MKPIKNPIYLRYEFSDESGRPEGGDIFQYGSLAEVEKMVGKILKVAHGDGVSVNLTIGQETPFFGFLKKVGIDRKAAAKEMVTPEPISETPSKKHKAKKRETPAKRR